jgi:septal ring factor EnvC (AmiA/AmiB activator)
MPCRFPRLLNTLSRIAQNRQIQSDIPAVILEEQQLKLKGLECLVAAASALANWTRAGERKADEARAAEAAAAAAAAAAESAADANPTVDDPTQFEELKHKKQLLQEGIKKFNWKLNKACIPLLPFLFPLNFLG